MAAELLDNQSYALIGCTVSPGFDDADHKFGDENMLTQYP